MPQNELFFVNYFALWVLTGVLALAIYRLYKYFGYQLLERAEARNAGGPDIDQVVDATFLTIDGHSYSLGNRPNVVLFTNPECLPCQEIRPVLSRVADKNPGAGLVVIHQGDADSARTYAQDLSASAVIVADPNGKFERLWQVLITPFVVVIDAKATVITKGFATVESEFQSFFSLAARSGA